MLHHRETDELKTAPAHPECSAHRDHRLTDTPMHDPDGILRPLTAPAVVGMVHLPALPGSPGHRRPMARLIDHALTDARRLEEAGCDAVLMENFGDAPFRATKVDPHTVAAMTMVGLAIRREVGLPLGVNVLRNDPRAALAVATAVGASFVRINVHCGVYATDQGVIEGRADDTLRYRRRLSPVADGAGNGVALLADVMVKHARPMSTGNIAEAAEETAYRGRADGLIVSGTATGRPTRLEDLRAVRQAVPDRFLLAGSGVTADSVRGLLDVADGVIVGTSIKEGGVTTAPVSLDRARTLVDAVRRGV